MRTENKVEFICGCISDRAEDKQVTFSFSNPSSKPNVELSPAIQNGCFKQSDQSPRLPTYLCLFFIIILPPSETTGSSIAAITRAKYKVNAWVVLTTSVYPLLVAAKFFFY